MGILLGRVGGEALGGGMHRAEFGNEVGRIFGGIDGEGTGDDKQGLGEFANGELFA